MTVLSRTPSTLSKMLLCVSSTLVAVLLGEFVVRGLGETTPVKVIELADPECVYQRSTNPRLGFELKKHYQHPSPDFIQNYERTNSHGQRDRERSYARTPGVQRILLVGDSVVEGYGLPEHATISSQWEDQSRFDIEVLNFGVSAYCTRAEIELLETKGLDFDPDIVILLFVENDFDNFNREAFPLRGSTPRPDWANWLFARSQLFQRVCLLGNLFHFRAETDPAGWNQAAIGNNNVSNGFHRFRQLATERDFEPLIAIWPRFEQTEIADVHFMPDGEQLVVEAIAAQHNLPTVRLSDYFPTNSKKSPRLTYTQGDQLHPSEAGAQLAATALDEILAQGVESFTAQEKADPRQRIAIKATLDKLQQAKPNYARVFNRLGNDALQAGQPAQAAEQYLRALQEDPRSAAAHHNLGIANERLDRPKDAMEHFERAIALQSDFAEAHYNLGRLQETTDLESAQTHYIRAVTIKPDFALAHFRLACLLLQEGRQRGGMHGLRRAAQLAPDNVSILNRLGGELAKSKHFQEARSYLERVVSMSPNHAEAQNNLGAVCVQLRDLEAARDAFEAALRARPEHPKAANNLTKVLAELEKK